MVGLKMPRAFEVLDHIVRKLEQGEITVIEAIDGLEYSTRETRRIDVALRTSKLLPIKTLEGFDFIFQRSLDRERIAAIAQLYFIRRAEVVHLLGPAGTGRKPLGHSAWYHCVQSGKACLRCNFGRTCRGFGESGEVRSTRGKDQVLHEIIFIHCL